MINEERKFLSNVLLNQKLKSKLKLLQLSSIKSAIPKTWKEKLKTIHEPIQDERLLRSNEPYTKIGMEIKPLQQNFYKQITNKLLINTIKPLPQLRPG